MAELSAAPAALAGSGGPALLDILVEAVRDVDVGGVVEVGLLSQVVLLLVVERVCAVPVVAFNALATGLEVAEEGGCDVGEAVGAVSGAPRVWHGVERGVGNDAIKREGMAEEVVGGIGLCREGFEDVVLLAEQSPEEVSILHSGEYTHSLFCGVHLLFPGLGEAALKALDLGLFHILLFLEVLKLVKGGNVSSGEVALYHCRNGFGVGMLR